MSASSPAPSRKPLLSDQLYTVLKHVAAVGLPALATLYFALAQIWHFPRTEEVMATITAVNTALGALVGISTLTYNNSDAKYVGAIEVTDNGQKKTYSLNLNSLPEALEQLKEATFKVTSVPAVVPVTPVDTSIHSAPVAQPDAPENPPTLGS